MADSTKIEWADATANFWIGCTKLSLACDHCYAERDWDHRKHRVEWGPHGDRSPVKAGSIVCRKVQKGAAEFIEQHGRRPRIFVNSLSDFADNHRSILPEWREQVWQMARECRDVIFMILTKRPQNLAGYLPADWGDGYPNVWIGTTVENQEEADRRIPHLLATPSAMRFLSCEPLLEEVLLDPCDLASLDWVIVGGESGPSARPMHPDWARSLRDQCEAADVPFFFKQWGEWAPSSALELEDRFRSENVAVLPDGRVREWQADYPAQRLVHDHMNSMHRIGKKRAGRLLDGREWNEVPDHG